jgi:hypothetical protein
MMKMNILVIDVYPPMKISTKNMKGMPAMEKPIIYV